MGPTRRGNEILEMGPTRRGNEIPTLESPASPDKKSASVLRAAKRNTSSKNEIPELRPE
jgi:hypothetical protein